MTFIKFFNQIKRSATIPKCTDCKYYVMSETGRNVFASAKCLKFESIGIESKKPYNEFAYIARGEKTMCGSYGLKFESK